MSLTETFTHKVGPLPMWVWAAGATGIALVIIARTRKSTGSSGNLEGVGNGLGPLIDSGGGGGAGDAGGGTTPPATTPPPPASDWDPSWTPDLVRWWYEYATHQHAPTDPAWHPSAADVLGWRDQAIARGQDPFHNPFPDWWQEAGGWVPPGAGGGEALPTMHASAGSTRVAGALQAPAAAPPAATAGDAIRGVQTTIVPRAG